MYIKFVGPVIADQFIVKPVKLTLDEDKLVGWLGCVKNVAVLEFELPLVFIACNLNVYWLPSVSPVKTALFADTPLSVAGVVKTLFI